MRPKQSPKRKKGADAKERKGNLLHNDIVEVAKLLARAESALFITGAGISAESGLPTYRGIGGIYENKLTELNLPIETVLSGQMMASKPDVTWQFIGQIEEACRGARHNKAHRIIAEIEKQMKRCWVLTQNIDGFHSEAGSKQVIDIHGDIHDLFCPECGYSDRVVDYSGLSFPPACPDCGSIIRPHVVLFGEMLPEDKLAVITSQLEEGFNIVFSIGTTSVFPYIAMPIYNARSEGNVTVEINPADSEVSDIVDFRFQAGAVDTLTQIYETMQGFNLK